MENVKIIYRVSWFYREPISSLERPDYSDFDSFIEAETFAKELSKIPEENISIVRLESYNFKLLQNGKCPPEMKDLLWEIKEKILKRGFKVQAGSVTQSIWIGFEDFEDIFNEYLSK